ncbi:hypothetical protein C2W62_02265, partial [Candidatus Entotheonella serta]
MQPVQVMKTAAWKTTDELPLSSESLAMMFAQQVPIIRIPNFATPEECNVLVEATEKLGFDAYESVTPQIDRIGLTVFGWWAGIIAAPLSGLVRVIILANIRAGFICLRVLNLSVVIIPT